MLSDRAPTEIRIIPTTRIASDHGSESAYEENVFRTLRRVVMDTKKQDIGRNPAVAESMNPRNSNGM
jgi:hypothetical protein